jgi:hypothetical protein
MGDSRDNATTANGLTANSEDPVVILTTSRSGSTLLRFILDSHPDLACPPETMIGSTCGTMVRLWEALEHSGDAQRPDVTRPKGVSDEGLAAIRLALDSAYGSYLKRRGKKRWCDKSLDTFQFAGIIRQIYPRARFIGLVRHCMDVIVSGVRTCPWGVSRYGFDPFVTQYPGNSVAAIGAYWLNCTRAIVEFRDQNPDDCVLVRYEDLVTAPEPTVAALLQFIGASPSPGITDACFALPHEERGPGDEKIWFTTQVSADSIGQGVGVPPSALPPDVRTAANTLLERLQYKTIGDDWRSVVGSFDPRADASPSPAVVTSPSPARAELDHVVRALEDRLATSSPRSEQVVSQWPSVAGTTMRLVAQTPAGDSAEVLWQFAPSGDGNGAGPAQMVASPATWMSFLDGTGNVMAAMTDGQLRCFNPNDSHRMRSDEVHAIAAVLGFAAVPVDHTQPAAAR